MREGRRVWATGGSDGVIQLSNKTNNNSKLFQICRKLPSCVWMVGARVFVDYRELGSEG